MNLLGRSPASLAPPRNGEPGNGDQPPQPPDPGPPGPPGNGDDDVVSNQLLREIKKLLQVSTQPKGVFPYFFDVTLDTGAVAQRLFQTAQNVVFAVIQNISTEDVSISRTNTPPTVGSNIILNAASAAGKGGGNLPVHNVNLRELMFIRTTAGATLAIYAELPTIQLPDLVRNIGL